MGGFECAFETLKPFNQKLYLPRQMTLLLEKNHQELGNSLYPVQLHLGWGQMPERMKTWLYPVKNVLAHLLETLHPDDSTTVVHKHLTVKAQTLVKRLLTQKSDSMGPVLFLRPLHLKRWRRLSWGTLPKNIYVPPSCTKCSSNLFMHRTLSFITLRAWIPGLILR